MASEKHESLRLTLDTYGAERKERRAELVAEGLVGVREAAEFLSISRSKLYEMMDGGLLPYVKLGRSRRVPRRALVELAAGELRGGYRM